VTAPKGPTGSDATGSDAPGSDAPGSDATGSDATGSDATGSDGTNRTGPRLILVRHGQTDANVSRALDSRPPGFPLNALGHEQAERVGQRLADEPIAAVYASVAPRAQQTAAPIAAAHGLDVQVVEHIHEIFCGNYEGRSDHESRVTFDEAYRHWRDGELDERIVGGESAAEVRDRVLPVLDRLWRDHAARGDEAFVVVSHGAAIQISVRSLLGLYKTTRYVPNTGRVVLVPSAYTDDGGVAGWSLERWDTAQDAGVPDPRGDVTGGAPEPDSDPDEPRD
jgi:probable phosphoglycerate mutase